MKNKLTVGFTTSFPVEVVFAAGHKPIDLNNIFISGNAAAAVHQAELKGFPRTICAWIKGNYTAARKAGIDEVIGIVQGDCANSQSLLGILKDESFPIYHFSFPLERDQQSLDDEISRLERLYGVTREDSERVKLRLDKIRRKLLILDELTWQEGRVNGQENHYWLVSASDFWGDPDRFEAELDAFLIQAEQRPKRDSHFRLAYLGVPPIYSNLYQTLSKLGADVVFNEVQRQFAMLSLKPDLLSQYLVYTYPYSVFERLEDILPELEKRKVQAVISYTQSFCHMQIDNMILKKKIGLPFLTLEGDQPEEIDSRTLLRLESFMEVHG